MNDKLPSLEEFKAAASSLPSLSELESVLKKKGIPQPGSVGDQSPYPEQTNHTVSESPSPDGTLSLQTRSANPDLSVPDTQPPAPAPQPQAAEGSAKVAQVQPTAGEAGGVEDQTAPYLEQKHPFYYKDNPILPKYAMFEASQRGDFKASDEIAAQMIEKNPQDPYAFRMLYYNAKKQGQPNIELLSKAIELNPNDPALLADVAFTSKNMGNLPAAFEAATRLASIAPESSHDIPSLEYRDYALGIMSDVAVMSNDQQTARKISAEREKIAQKIREKTPTSNDYILSQSINNSMVGNALKAGLPAGSTNPEFDIFKDYKPTTKDELLAGLGALLIDMPAFGPGGVVGSAASRGAIGMYTSFAIKKAAAEMAKMGMSKEAINVGVANLSRAIASSSVAGYATAAASSAGALGYYDASAGVLRQLAGGANIEDVDYGQTLKSFEHGHLLGVIVGPIGYGTHAAQKAVTKYINRSTDLTGMAAKAAKFGASAGAGTVGFSVENIGFVGGGALLEGKPLSEITTKDWVMSFGTLGGLKGINMVKGFMKSENFSSDKINQGEFNATFTPAEQRAISRLNYDYDLNNPPKDPTEILSNPEVPQSAKMKILWSGYGVKPTEFPAIYGVRTEQMPDGTWNVSTTNKEGAVVTSVDYPTREQASEAAIEAYQVIKDVKTNESIKELTPEEKAEVLEKLKLSGTDTEQVAEALDKMPADRTAEETTVVNNLTETVSETKSAADKIRGMKKPVEPKVETPAESVTPEELPPPPADMVIDGQGGVKKVEPKTEPPVATEPAAPEVKTETVEATLSNDQPFNPKKDLDTNGDLTDNGFSKVESKLKSIINTVSEETEIPSDILLNHYNITNGEYISSKTPILKVGESVDYLKLIDAVKKIAIKLNPENAEKIINTVEKFKQDHLDALEKGDNNFKVPNEIVHIYNALSKINEEFNSFITPTEAVKPSEVSTPKTTTNEKETQGQGRQVLTETPETKLGSGISEKPLSNFKESQDFVSEILADFGQYIETKKANTKASDGSTDGFTVQVKNSDKNQQLTQKKWGIGHFFAGDVAKNTDGFYTEKLGRAKKTMADVTKKDLILELFSNFDPLLAYMRGMPIEKIEALLDKYKFESTDQIIDEIFAKAKARIENVKEFDAKKRAKEQSETKAPAENMAGAETNPLTEVVSKYGWQANTNAKGETELVNAKGKFVAKVVQKGSKYTISHPDGTKLLTGNGPVAKGVERVMTEYFYAKEGTKPVPTEMVKPVTPEEVKAKAAEAKNPDIPLKEQKKDLLGQMDEAISVVRNGNTDAMFNEMVTPESVQALKDKGFKVDEVDEMRNTTNINRNTGRIVVEPTGNKVYQVIFDVEGDGTFSLNLNTLDKSRETVAKNFPTTPKMPENKTKLPVGQTISGPRNSIQIDEYDAFNNYWQAKKSGNEKLAKVFKDQLGPEGESLVKQFDDTNEGRIGFLKKQIETYKSILDDRIISDNLKKAYEDNIKKTQDEIDRLNDSSQPSSPSTATSIQDLQTRFKDKAGTPEYNKRMEELRKESTVNKAIDFLDNLKIDTKGKAFDATLGIPILIWNASIDTIKFAIKAGKTVADAIDEAVAYVKRRYPKVDEQKYRDLYKGVFDTQTDKLRDDVRKTLVDQYSNIEKEMFGSETKTDADFNNTATHFGKGLGVINNVQEYTFGTATDKITDGIAKLASKAVESKRQPVRILGKTMNSLFQNISRSLKDVARKEQFIGESKDRNIADAVKINKTLREIINNDEVAMRRIDEVLDPDFYRERDRQEFEEMISGRKGFDKLTPQDIDKLYADYRTQMGFDDPSYRPVTYDDLAPHEQAAAEAIGKIYDFMHDANFAIGKLSLDTYIQNKGKYATRLYDAFEFPDEINEAFGAGTKMQQGMYKERGNDITEWKIEHKIDDPIHAVTKRLYQTMLNKGVYDYSKWITDNHPTWVSNNEKPGYTQLGNGYGKLSNKFVRDDVAEDFKGFFFTTKALQNTYDAIKSYSRWNPDSWILKPVSRQFYRKLFTEWNPAVQLGNHTGNIAFAAWLGISPLRFETNFVKAVNHVRDYSSTYRYLLSKGILNSDLTRADLINGKEAYDAELAKAASSPNPIKAMTEIPSKVYRINDDLGKIAAFESLIQFGMTPEKALNRVADSFQNFKRVGKAYDVTSQIPVAGNMFGRWGGDLMRIVKNGVTRRPLSIAAFGATLKMLAYFASAMSGESDDEKKIREQRIGFPKIGLPDWMGGDIPLALKVGSNELNIARFVSPIYFYSTPDQDDMYQTFNKFSPVQWQFPRSTTNPNGRIAVAVAQNLAKDPVFAPLIQLMVNSDFKGAPVIDPNETIYKKSTLTADEKIVNSLRFLARGYVPYGSFVDDLARAAMGQQDYYGRDKTMGQVMLRFLGYNSQQFKTERYKKVIDDEFKHLYFQHVNILQSVKNVRKDYYDKKIDEATARKRIAKFMEQDVEVAKSIEKLRQKGIPFLKKNGIATPN